MRGEEKPSRPGWVATVRCFGKSRPGGRGRSTLRELEATTRTGLAVLLAFHFAGVPGEEAALAEGAFQRRVVTSGEQQKAQGSGQPKLEK